MSCKVDVEASYNSRDGRGAHRGLKRWASHWTSAGEIEETGPNE